MVLVSGALADIELQSVPPPQPSPVQVKTFLGESVEIPLSGVSRSNAALQFLIRRQPALGALSPIRMTGPNTAVVTYTHNKDTGIGIDRFRYAVGAPGIGFSTPAEVVVTVSERPPVFIAPTRIEFPRTIAGRASLETVELRNDGGGVVSGRLGVKPPWHIVDGDGEYSLGPQGVQLLTISFVPVKAGSFTGSAEFSHAPDTGVVLVGQGFDPVEIVPREVRLESDGHREARTGDFLLRNISDEDFDLRIEAPAEVVVQDSIRVAARSEQQVTLHTRAGFLSRVDGVIKVTGKGVNLEAPLQVMPAPSRIVVEPAKIDLGSLETGRTGRAKFTVRNVGGMPASLSAKTPAGVSLSPDPRGARLEPGASREFEVRLSRPIAGEFSGEVVIEGGESQAKFAVTAKLRAVGADGQASAQSVAAVEAAYGDIPAVMQIGVTRQTRTELDLSWRKASPEVAKYVLYMRKVSFDGKGNATYSYQRLDRVKPRFVRNDVRVTLAGLRPGESVTLCVVGFDAKGLPSRPSPPLTVATLPKPVFHIPWLWVLGVALVAIVALIVWERRRARAAGASEMEAHLERMKS